MARTLSRGLAPIVEQLELEQPHLITLHTLAQLSKESNAKSSPRVIAARLIKQGWLLPTGIPAVYEFAPASNAGPHGMNDPATLFAAALTHDPTLQASLSGDSAAWALGYADRAPTKLTIATPTNTSKMPAALTKKAHITRFDAKLPPTTARTVPTQQTETLIVWLASKPNHVVSWETVQEWLPRATTNLNAQLILQELENRPNTTKVRLGYLLQALRPDIAEEMLQHVSSKVWFGPRARLRRHSANWMIADTALPFDPAQLLPE